MNSLSGWDGAFFRGWVVSWHIGPLCFLFTNFKEKRKACAHDEHELLFSKLLRRSGRVCIMWLWIFLLKFGNQLALVIDIYIYWCLLTIRLAYCIVHIFAIRLSFAFLCFFVFKNHACIFFHKIMIFIVAFYYDNPNTCIENIQS